LPIRSNLGGQHMAHVAPAGTSDRMVRHELSITALHDRVPVPTPPAAPRAVD